MARLPSVLAQYAERVEKAGFGEKEKIIEEGCAFTFRDIIIRAGSDQQPPQKSTALFNETNFKKGVQQKAVVDVSINHNNKYKDNMVYKFER